MKKYIVLVTDDQNWWFDLEASSLTEAGAKAELRLKEMGLWALSPQVEIIEPFERQRLQGVDSDASFILAADGSCLENPGPGGWAALLTRDGREIMRSGGEEHTTNNRMEISAVLQGLYLLPKPSKVRIIVDSRYVMDAYEKGWLINWKKNGWKTASKEAVKNQDLWELLDGEIQKHEITWQWVKGHTGLPLNEKVDKEAGRQARNYAQR